MARNEKARDSKCETYKFSRRSYLRLAGSAAATVIGVAGSSTASSNNGLLLEENFEDNDYQQIFTDTSYRNADNESLVSSVAKNGSNSLKVDIEENTHQGTWAKYDPVEAGDSSEELTEMYLSYWVMFPSDFQAGRGGKLPGIVHIGPNGGGVGGDPAMGTNGWSCRITYEGAGGDEIKIGPYVYHMDQSGTYGDPHRNTVIQRGKWVKITEYVKLNTVSGGSANNDGELKMWVDGNLEYERTNFRFVTDRSLGCNCLWQIYFGGNWTSPKDQAVFIDSLAISESTKPKKLAG
ncbi:polysaccharide lyase [Haladaptatus sp. NG-SE-30]